VRGRWLPSCKYYVNFPRLLHQIVAVCFPLAGVGYHGLGSCVCQVLQFRIMTGPWLFGESVSSEGRSPKELCLRVMVPFLSSSRLMRLRGNIMTRFPFCRTFET
jgi:hypothetical protein